MFQSYRNKAIGLLWQFIGFYMIGTLVLNGLISILTSENWLIALKKFYGSVLEWVKIRWLNKKLRNCVEYLIKSSQLKLLNERDISKYNYFLEFNYWWKGNYYMFTLPCLIEEEEVMVFYSNFIDWGRGWF